MSCTQTDYGEASTTGWWKRVNCVLKVCSRSGNEPVPNLPDSDDVLRLGRIVLELPPQFSDVRVDGPGHHERAVTPHFSQKIGAASDRTSATNECKQQLIR